MFGHQDHDNQDQSHMSIPQDVVDSAAPPAGPPADGGTISADTAAPTEMSGDVISPAGGFPKTPSLPSGNDDDGSDHGDSTSNHDLIEIKQKALTELFPLIDKLDQTPEERFKTLMMMIQASDNQHLVKAAFDAAQSIEDEKTRAQALLDVINEVNYFTTPHEQ